MPNNLDTYAGGRVFGMPGMALNIAAGGSRCEVLKNAE